MALPMDCYADEMLRKCVVGKIDAVRGGVVDPGEKTSQEIEEALFAQARSRDEYMQLIAALMLHYRQPKRKEPNTSASPEENGVEEEGAACQQREQS